MKHVVKIKGYVTVKVFSSESNPTYESTKNAKPLKTFRARNLVVTAGKNELANWLIGQNYSSGLMYCGVGSSDQTPSPSDTDLIQPIGSRKQASDRFTTGNVATISTFFSSNDNNGTWRECGLFENQTGAPMFARVLFNPPIVKDASKTITVDWDIEVT